VVERVVAAMTEIATADATAFDSGAILVISHGGTIRSFIHATTGVIPPPLENGTVFRIHFDGRAFVAAEPVVTGP
jgi:broad specificity phosphatase PhoE